MWRVYNIVGDAHPTGNDYKIEITSTQSLRLESKPLWYSRYGKNAVAKRQILNFQTPDS
jgi:hypothetical protein